MNSGKAQEIPLVYDCDGAKCVGIIHRPPKPAAVGIVIIIAGGPQFRAGVGRGMVSLARALAASGVAVMRFDHRGLGDSGGEFQGFEHYARDLQCAVDTLRSEVPQVQNVVLWGGCDAASGAMIHAYKLDGVISLALGNPWLTTAETQAVVMRQHYLSRLMELSFWRKLLRFEYDFADYLRAGLAKFTSRLGRLSQAGDDSIQDDDASGDFVERMLGGLQKFNGPVLFVMSGQSMLSREFDELIKRDSDWRAVYGRKNCRRVDFPEADQTFSDANARHALNRTILAWVKELDLT